MIDSIRNIIEDENLLREGHFVLISGRHSNFYWEKFRVLEDPNNLAALCRPIVNEYINDEIDIIVGPTLGGVIVAYEVARQMGKIAVYAERSINSSDREFRNNGIINSTHRVLIVDDVIMSGFTLKTVINAVRELGADICGIGVILDRSKNFPVFPYPIFCVHRMEIPDYDPEVCPLCDKGIPTENAAGNT